MQIQQIFKAGNSSVVSIPKNLMKELGLKSGQKVVVGKTSDGSAFVVKKIDKVKKSKSKLATTKEFNRWLKDVLKEDAEILDELAVR